MSRLGQRLLAIGGICVAALMAYTVILDLGFLGRGDGDPATGSPVIPVFYPERVYWREFREGIQVCARKNLLRIVDETDLSVEVESSKSNRRIGFVWQGVRGVVALREEVEGVLSESPPPVAIIGSSNTVLTQAIARTLNEASEGQGAAGPLLLIPWASSVLTDRSEPNEPPIGLLDILHGRTFRFCPNNQAQAGLLVDCMARRPSPVPAQKVIIIEDRQDPYSIDLADSFHREIEHAAPGVELDERSLRPEFPSSAQAASREDALAASIWDEIDKLKENRALWLVLPLQEEPSQRMIESLIRQARRGNPVGANRFEVLTGDSLGLDILGKLAGHCPFPIWSVSTNSPSSISRQFTKEFSADAQLPAEIVSSLIFALDQLGDAPFTSASLRKQLESIQWNGDDPRAIARPLRFRKSGERVSDEMGHVLTIQPDDPRVMAIPRLGKDRWGPAVEVAPGYSSSQP